MVKKAQPLVEHVSAAISIAANEGSVPLGIECLLVLYHLIGSDLRDVDATRNHLLWNVMIFY